MRMYDKALSIMELGLGRVKVGVDADRMVRLSGRLTVLRILISPETIRALRGT